MELEELKKDWKVFEAKIEKSIEINDRLIESMIRERSVSRISKMKNQYMALFIIMSIEAIFLVAILLGNPFDFKEKWQFLPYLGLIIGVVMAIISILKLYKKLDFDFGAVNTSIFLIKILEYYKKNKVYEKWFGILILLNGFLLPLSFLPKKIERYGLQRGLLDTGIMMAFTFLIYIIAIRMGAFRNRHEEKMKSDLQEYDTLKSISEELI
jgi:ABC-type uncharacterized transport system permease subunit